MRHWQGRRSGNKKGRLDGCTSKGQRPCSTKVRVSTGLQKASPEGCYQGSSFWREARVPTKDAPKDWRPAASSCAPDQEASPASASVNENEWGVLFPLESAFALYERTTDWERFGSIWRLQHCSRSRGLLKAGYCLQAAGRFAEGTPSWRLVILLEECLFQVNELQARVWGSHPRSYLGAQYGSRKKFASCMSSSYIVDKPIACDSFCWCW